MEKLIELLRERKPNFDENHILDMMYSEGIIFIKDGKPVYTYDKIFPNSERMIINGKLGFIKWLVENDKIDLDNEAMQYAKSDLSKFFTEWKDKNGMSDDYAMLLMLLAIQDEPVEFLLSILK